MTSASAEAPTGTPHCEARNGIGPDDFHTRLRVIRVREAYEVSREA